MVCSCLADVGAISELLSTSCIFCTASSFFKLSNAVNVKAGALVSDTCVTSPIRVWPEIAACLYSKLPTKESHVMCWEMRTMKIYWIKAKRKKKHVFCLVNSSDFNSSLLTMCS